MKDGKVFEVAKYIIVLSQHDCDPIGNLKLQKLMYYAQGWHMAENNGKELFEDDFEAWVYGPAIPRLYGVYKKWGYFPIEEVVDIENCNISDAEKSFSALCT